MTTPQIYALLLGNGTYTDSSINPLQKVTQDVAAMQQVLTDPKIGRVLPDNLSAHLNLELKQAKRVISDFFGNKQRHDLLILYYSGHGLRDDKLRLYLAMQDTDKAYLHDEALPASFIAEKMSQSRAKQQIIILDCCHSGAFKPAPATDAPGLTAVVLTASDSTELAWEDDPNLPHALFTHHVIQGLQSTVTDKNGDGLISVDELYQYVQQQLANSKQKPQRLVPFGRYEQELIIAQSVHQSPNQIDPKLLQGHHFICYAGTDGDEVAFALAEQLRAQHCPVWLDVDDVQPFGHPREQQIKQAIETCLSLLFVVTPDSLLPESTCGAEWRKALSAKKPLVLLMTAEGLELPLPLQPRKQLDWRDPHLEALLAYLAALNSPAGQVELLTQRLTEAETELNQTRDSSQRQRIKNDITALRWERARLEQAALDPTAAAAATQQSIAARLDLERRPVDAPQPTLRVINPPPAAVPSYFQDRHQETKLLLQFLADDNRRVALVIGRGGVGKTAVVTRLLRTLERGELPDKLSGTQPIQGIVYLSQAGSRRINLPNLFADVCRLLPPAIAQPLEAIYREPQRSTADKVGALLAQITGLPLIVLCDNFEDLLAGYPTPALPFEGEGVQFPPDVGGINPTPALPFQGEGVQSPPDVGGINPTPALPFQGEGVQSPPDVGGINPTPALPFEGEGVQSPPDVGGIKGGRLDDRQIVDQELAEALQTILTWPYHSLKVIITSRLTVAGLPQPQRQFHLNLEEGLVSPYRETVLREMDADGTVGLQRADDATLAPICHFTRGYPRALEAFYGILAADRATHLSEVLATLEQTPPEQVVEVLVGEAFQRLEATAQKVMQALAIYGRPVTATAVDYLLEPYLPTVDSQLHLNRLVNLQLVRKEAGLFYLHQVDRQFALSRLPKGESTDRTKVRPSVPKQANSQPIQQEFFTFLGLQELPHDEKVVLQEKLTKEVQEKTIHLIVSQLNDEQCELLNQRMATGMSQDEVMTHLRHEIPNLDEKINNMVQNLRDELFERFAPLRQELAAPNPFTQIALYHRAADYFKQTRHPRHTWKKLADLEPQLAEIDLRMQAEDYNTAADVLTEIDFNYLLLWGYYRLMIQLHEGLQGKITEAKLKQGSVGSLGSAYAQIGQVQQAITCQEQALAMAREAKDKWGEGAWLGNLGSAYSNLGQTARAIEYQEQALAIDREIGDKRGEGADLSNLGNRYAELGQTARAIEYYEQALAIAREIGDRRGEGADLGNLGLAYAALGQTARAIEFYEQALAIARETGDKRSEGNQLGNLGIAYAALGQTVRAIEYYEQALAIHREIGNRRSESIVLDNMGRVLVDQNKFEQAIQSCQHAIQIADEIGLVLIQNYGRWGLALAYLLQSLYKVSNLIKANEVKATEVKADEATLAQAWAAIEAARGYDVPQNNHHVSVLRGIIARWVAVGVVRPAFEEALGQAEVMLRQTPNLYEALDAKALALQGLGRVAEAQVAYQQARALNSEAGVVARVKRLWGLIGN